MHVEMSHVESLLHDPDPYSSLLSPLATLPSAIFCSNFVAVVVECWEGEQAEFWGWVVGGCGILQFVCAIPPPPPPPPPPLYYNNPLILPPVTSGLWTNVPNIIEIVVLICWATSLFIRSSGTPRELPMDVIRSICRFVLFILVIICSASDLSFARSFSTWMIPWNLLEISS